MSNVCLSSNGMRDRSIRSSRCPAIVSTQRSTAESIPRPEQVDLQEPGVRAGVLVPLHDLAVLHRRRHDRHAVDQGPCRDHHPAGVLPEVPWEPVGLVGELGEPVPSAGAHSAPGRARCGCLRRRCRARPSRQSRGRHDRARRRAGRGPCRARGSRPAHETSGSWRPARRDPARSAWARCGISDGADIPREVDVDVRAAR